MIGSVLQLLLPINDAAEAYETTSKLGVNRRTTSRFAGTETGWMSAVEVDLFVN